jgi:spore germination protein KB
VEEKESISTNQFIWMLVAIIAAPTSLSIPGDIILQTQQDSWLSVIGGWFLDVLLALIYAYMGLRFRGENFVQYSSTILGKYAGKIVGGIFPLFFIFVSIGIMWDLSRLITLVFLPQTPIEVILICGYIVVGYGARKGIEVVVRNAEFMAPVFVFSIIMLALLLLPSIKMEQLKPQLVNGVYPILSGSFYVLTFYGICIMMAMFIPICNRPENGFLSKFTAVTIGSLVVGIIIVVSIAVFGVEQAKVLIYPGLELSKIINIGNFLSRVEVIWMAIAIGTGILTTTSLIWAVSLGAAQIVGLNTYKPLVFPFVLLCIVMTIVSPHRNVELISFARYTFPVLAIIVESGLEIFLFIMALIFNKRGNTS